jgi:hypothetical protein
MHECLRTVVTMCAGMTVAAAAPAIAQRPMNTGPAGAAVGAPVGGDLERYMRALELTGRIAPAPWATRPFDANDLQELLEAPSTKPHPWRDAMRRSLAKKAAVGGSLFVGANSGFPWGSNDGPMWQGRGVNSAIALTASVRWGRLTAVAAPMAFVAQNSGFPLMGVSADGSPFADSLYTGIDLPQRFGDRAYHRIDGGESSISLRGLGMVAGVSTASHGWGPGESFPAVLGPNAGGFPHVFIGTTGRGIRVPRIGHFNARYVLGVLDQSAYSPVSGGEVFVGGLQSGTKRVAVGMTVSYMPALLPTLEVGATRFYHSPYRKSSQRWDAWSKPFEGIFKNSFDGRSGPVGDQNGDFDNQLASVFARWSFPGRGGEVSFEYFREDHSWDARDLAAEPENNAAVIASFRAATHRSDSELALLTFEYFDGDIPPIAQVRPSGGLYIHGTLLQGHTQRGQLLGSPVGAGAMTGQSVTWERFTQKGSTRINLRRWRSRSKGSALGGIYFNVESPVPNYHDWTIDGSYGATRYLGASALSVDAGVAYAGRWQLANSRTNVYVRTSLSLF